MKKLNINQFDKKDEEITDALVSLGLGRSVARTLAYLNNGEEATSVSLERWAGMHQPEVSIVMKQLKEKDWINERYKNNGQGKGRPLKIYTLKVGFKDIIAQLENQQKKADVEAHKNIERLREFGK